MQIAFLMDPLAGIDPQQDTTAHLMYECNQRGHRVFFLEPHDLYIRSNTVVARMRNITVGRGQTLKAYWRGLIRCLKKDELIFESITDLDVLFLRYNPPLHYALMEILEPVQRDVFIVNSTRGQIMASSKLFILKFPTLIPETHVSRDPSRLRKIIDDFGGTMLIKPLARYNGEGVIKVNAQDPENLNSLINYYVRATADYPERQPIMVQEYMSTVQTDGDVRILLLNGDILGAMRRTPQNGHFRTNIQAGARPCRHRVTDAEAAICAALKETLVKNGLYFVAIDIIADKLVALNCISPGGLPAINRLERARLEQQVVDFLESRALCKSTADCAPNAVAEAAVANSGVAGPFTIPN
ncbi:MAG: glutathione synthase [Pseudomonadota bacterium]